MEQNRLPTPNIPNPHITETHVGVKKAYFIELPNWAGTTTKGLEEIGNIQPSTNEPLVCSYNPTDASKKSGTYFPILAQKAYENRCKWVVIDPRTDPNFYWYSQAPFAATASVAAVQVVEKMKKMKRERDLTRRDLLVLGTTVFASFFAAQWGTGFVPLSPNMQDMRHTTIAQGLKQLAAMNLSNNLYVVAEQVDIDGIGTHLQFSPPAQLMEFYSKFKPRMTTFEPDKAHDNTWYQTSVMPIRLF